MQLERRVAFRRAMKKVMQAAMKAGPKEIKIKVSGRLAGAEMARTEWYMEGEIPLIHCERRLYYGFAEADDHLWNHRAKVWIFKGEVLQKGIQPEKKEEAPARDKEGRGTRRRGRQ